MAAEEDCWYWCLHHRRAEMGAARCPATELMGPYPSQEAARNWRQRVEERNDQWDAEDRAWTGDDDG